MPLYEYYCPTCNARFELLRPMARAEEPAACPQGHAGARRTLSVFAAVTRGDAGEPAPASGGCACGGGGCGCSL